jgi:hypothetical protein
MTRGMQGFWSYYNFPLHKSSGNNLQHTMDTPTSVEKLALDRLAAATSAGAIVCQTVQSNLRTIETLIQSDATKPEAVIVAKFTESIHMLAAYRNIFSDILTQAIKACCSILSRTTIRFDGRRILSMSNAAI